MAIRNYYVVLGVPPTESASGIRARRRLYDHSLREAELPSRPAAEVIVSRPDWSKPEPLDPEPRSLFRDYVASVPPARRSTSASPGTSLAEAFPRQNVCRRSRSMSCSPPMRRCGEESLRSPCRCSVVAPPAVGPARTGSFPASGAGSRGSWRKRKRSRSSFHGSLNQARSSMSRFGS